jgi:cellobiose phosphorylase
MAHIELSNESGFDLHSLHGARGLKIHLLPNGCLYSIEHGPILINQVLGSPVAGGVHRIYLRVHEDKQVRYRCIVGPDLASSVSVSERALAWTGEWHGIVYRCICELHPDRDAWFFRINIDNTTARTQRCDAILVQDLGLATRGQVRNNESFTSQYIDHFAAEHPEAGYVLMSRQNLPQPGQTHPWLLQGCFPRASGFVTDGFDFFGPAHRGTLGPIALGWENIGTHVRQFEAGYTAIQSSIAELKPKQPFEWTFFADYQADHPQASSAVDLGRVAALKIEHSPVQDGRSLEPQRSLFQSFELFEDQDLQREELSRLFPEPWRQVEYVEGKLASFLYGPDSRHVVLRGKEVSTTRSHGTILRAGKGVMPDSELLTCTCSAPGIFASQLTLGNASLSKLFSGTRDPLNVVRSSGLRMFVFLREMQEWYLLTVPSAFEMALNQCTWFYKIGSILLTVSCVASEDEPAITFDVRVEGAPVDLLICGEISAGPMEYDSSPRVSIDREAKRITIQPDPASMLGKLQPQAMFQIVTSAPESVEALGGDEGLFADRRSRGYPYLTIRTKPIREFSFSIVGSLTGDPRATQERATESFWNQMTAGVRVRSEHSDKADLIQDTLTWFARDAVIHLSAPRGLDQPNGGAWGVRDVCQGPLEFLLSYGHDDTVAEILRRLFSQQYHRRHDWPQWFMFPPFQQIQSTHCHGDVAIWPLKALCDYLEQTNDESILHEQLPYTDEETFQQTPRREEMLQHVDRLLELLRSQFLPGTALLRFGEGDWDDSLQPADPALRERMVSSWTSELMYQTVMRYAAAMQRMDQPRRAEEAEALGRQIHADFHRYLMPNGVVAGFSVFDGNPPRPVEYLLHPSDSRTGLRYRLIPMTRGILSEMFSPDQAQSHLALIQKHLLFPDGARLMDRPTTYAGGIERTFRRSESAAFFGREIGLQYVHAHLRYAEALAKLGRADELWHALGVVNPIAVTELVPGAQPRQRNCYFSSSDAAFATRYEASRDYEKLRSGEIGTDGGWRVYSSGPGIYTNLVIRHLFGLRRYFDSIEFDPVLPRDLDGVTCELTQNGRRVRYLFTTRSESKLPAKIRVNGREISTEMHSRNSYRCGALSVPRAEFEEALTPGVNAVEVAIPSK